MEVHIAWPGREELKARVELDQKNNIVRAELLGIGGPDFIQAVSEFRMKLRGPLSALPLPQGVSAQAIMLRELVLRLKGEWSPPYKDDEICHCRAVPTQVVDLAICTGAHTPREVSDLTAASTACGTCRPDVEAMINYRLKGTP